MRPLLIAVMLIIAVLFIYDTAFNGPKGAGTLLGERAKLAQSDAEGIDPSR